MTVNIRESTKFEGTHYSRGVQSLALDLEARMIAAGVAVNTAAVDEINVSRPAVKTDNGLDPLKDTSTTPITYTLNDVINSAVRIAQMTTGVITVVSDATAEMTGPGGTVITSLATTGIGSMILIEPINLNVFPRKYLVIKGGA